MTFQSSLVGALLISRIWLSNSQGCSNTCPPLNYGTLVPSLCEGDDAGSIVDLDKRYTPCDSNLHSDFSWNEFRGRITVLANFYVGCNAGRRESGVFAHVAQRYFEAHPNDVVFVTSLKGGATCSQWASIYQSDAVDLYPNSVVPKEMPIAVNDWEYEIRDDFFTTPFGHPSYVILDQDLRVRHKFVGPCCGYESFFDCTADIAKRLDATLSEYLDQLLLERNAGGVPALSPNQGLISNTIPIQLNTGCNTFSEWSSCSTICGEGIRFRFRTNCPSSPIETQSCFSGQICPMNSVCASNVETVATGFTGARDVSFHPAPGLHLGTYSEGRSFRPSEGEEVWVLNAHNHSVSIVASLGTPFQTTVSRRDRGYYHYMANATAFAFNMVANSGRTPDRDSFQYWAVCNDNTNTYLNTKEQNFFMGPTLYNSDPRNGNIVNRLGEQCGPAEECFFLHADMLHEAPACIGIVHDPETRSSHGNVYWAFDATGNGRNGELVRFDFQQPHGPGSMDHSVASVRRYPGVVLSRGPLGVHAGMVVHAESRQLFIAVPGANKIIALDTDSGRYARTAREEYPIFSNRLPSFEYSIFECETQRDFAVGIQMPTGLALSNDGRMLFVAERVTGNVLVYEVSTGALLKRIRTNFRSIGGLAVSPSTGSLYFVDEDSNSLNKIDFRDQCIPSGESRAAPAFEQFLANARARIPNFSLYRDYSCTPDPIVADGALFDQVHDDTGYASDNPDVQSMAGMDESAALLASRNDCGFFSELNFDQLLLGGFYCHRCLPGSSGAQCDPGGKCTNVQWQGYTCDNEFHVRRGNGQLQLERPDGSQVDPFNVVLEEGVTYRFTVQDDNQVCTVDTGGAQICASRGPLIVAIKKSTPRRLELFSMGGSLSLRVSTAFLLITPTDQGGNQWNSGTITWESPPPPPPPPRTPDPSLNWSSSSSWIPPPPAPTNAFTPNWAGNPFTAAASTTPAPPSNWGPTWRFVSSFEETSSSSRGAAISLWLVCWTLSLFLLAC